MSGTDTGEGASARDGAADCIMPTAARCLVPVVTPPPSSTPSSPVPGALPVRACAYEVRYGCLREDSCHFAHSFIELKVWLLQQYSR